MLNSLSQQSLILFFFPFQMVGLNLEDLVLIFHGPHSFNGLVDVKDITAFCTSLQQNQ